MNMNGVAIHLLPLSSSLSLRTPPPPSSSFPPKKDLLNHNNKGGLGSSRRSSEGHPTIQSSSLRLRQWAVGVRARGSGGGADVKSDPLDVPESIKFTAAEGLVPRPEVEEESNGELVGKDGFPKRWVIVILCFSSFLLCNMDRVNMSIAILPMSAEYNWSPSTVGLIQSSFFWGYLLTQIAGGVWADTVGGKRVLGFGVVWWSVATALTPVAAKLGLPFLLLVRAFMGIGEGVAMPAMNNILSKWIPVAERSRSLALVYSGMYLGSVTGLAFSPFLIHKFGWPSVFFSFGSLGTVWFAIWLNKYGASARSALCSGMQQQVLQIRTNCRSCISCNIRRADSYNTSNNNILAG